MIPIILSLCKNAKPWWQYGCTQPKERRRITKRKKILLE
jgi:hypothetical protein